MKSIKHNVVKFLGVFFFFFVLLVALNTVQAANENVQKTQQLLSKLGYQPGVADGLFGAKTHKALKKYQKDNNLPITGQIDGVTAKALGVDIYSPKKGVNGIWKGGSKRTGVELVVQDGAIKSITVSYRYTVDGSCSVVGGGGITVMPGSRMMNQISRPFTKGLAITNNTFKSTLGETEITGRFLSDGSLKGTFKLSCPRELLSWKAQKQ